MNTLNHTRPLLAVEELRVSYRYAGGIQDAVKGISFEVGSGQFVSLVGESGSGKSTVAAALIGLLPGTGHISGGHMYLEGLDITGAAKKHLREIRGSKIGYIPQDALSGLDPLMRIGYQVQEAVLAHTKIEKRAARKKTIESLFDAGLTDPETAFSSFPHELSGGMKQRSLIAAGMINAPQLLIADEPTSSLDVLVQQKILASIKRLINESNCALLFITHNIALAAEHSDYLMVMKDGVIAEQGRARTIWEQPKAPYTRELIAAIPKIAPQAGSGRPPVCLIELDQVTKYYPNSAIPALENVTLPIYEETITAIIGGSGSGKTTLASVIVQLEQQSSGSVYYLGNDICRFSKEELKQYRRAVQMIFQNPYESLNPLFSVQEIIGEPLRTFSSSDKKESLKQPFGIPMLRFRKHPMRRSGLHDMPLMHHRNSVGN
ncbi:hypothetical protein AGMMS49944_07610 [Spirochaetia bacterium]|nr:hypothetical protein AGMMS49944_07610 [Spirochaetia bacterium]